MIKQMLLWVLLFNMQVVFGFFTEENLKDFIEKNKDDIRVRRTSFGFPKCIVLKNEKAKEAWEAFLRSMPDGDGEPPIYGIRSVPTKRTLDESKKCFWDCSREASPKELALVHEYGVEYVRIIDLDSIVNGLPEELQQEVFRVRAMLEAYQRAIGQGGSLWLRIEDAILEGVSCNEFSLEKIDEIVNKCTEAEVSGKREEATKAGTLLEKWKADLHLTGLETSLEDLRAVKQWYDYIHEWFNEISICLTRRVAVYVQEGTVSDEFSGEQADLRFEGNFLCKMNPETIGNFRKEFRKDFLNVFLESIKATPYGEVKCKPEFFVLCLVLLKDLEFSADYGYYASNLTERLRLALDDMYMEQQNYDRVPECSENVSEALCGFLSFALYDRLGIMWNYSLVGDLDLPLEQRLFGLLKAPSDMAPVQLSSDTVRLWFGLNEATSETVEMDAQKFYNLIQMVTLHGGPENIWTGVGFASIDGCVYVNRMIMGQSSYVLPYYRHKFSCHTLLSMDKFGIGPKISEKIRTFFQKSTPDSIREILEKVEKRVNVSKPWNGPMQVGYRDEKALYEICKPWIVWLQLVSGPKTLPHDSQREINSVLPFMNKYLVLYTGGTGSSRE